MLSLLTSALAQTEDHTTTAWKIAAFASAAPSQLGGAATILDADQSILRPGSNGWICMPSNPAGPADAHLGWASAAEAAPICIDGEGMKWLQGYITGTAPVMDRDAYVYMMAGDLGFCNSDPTVVTEDACTDGSWIKSGPHLMLMPKDPTALAAPYSTDFSIGAPYVMFQGSPYVHLMIPLSGYYMYQAPDSEVSRLAAAFPTKFAPKPTAAPARGFVVLASASVGLTAAAAVLIALARRGTFAKATTAPVLV